MVLKIAFRIALCCTIIFLLLVPANRNRIALLVTHGSTEQGIATLGDIHSMRLTAFIDRLAGHEYTAVDKLKAFRAAVPEDIYVRLLLADWLFEIGDREEAIEQWSQINDGRFMVNQALEMIDQDEWELAALLLENSRPHALSTFGFQFDLAQAHTTLVTHYLLAEQNSQLTTSCAYGTEAFDEAAELVEFAHVYVMYAVHLRKCQKYDAALEQLRRVDDRFQSHHWAWASHEIGLTYIAQGREEEAIRALAQSVCYAPENTTYRATLTSYAGESAEAHIKQTCSNQP